MTLTAAVTGAQTGLYGEMLFFTPTFWGQLSAEQRRSCRQSEPTLNIDGRQAWYVSDILLERWEYMFPYIQRHLNDRTATIFKNRDCRQIAYDFQLYMIGTPTSFSPKVVACCIYLDISKRVLKVIRQKLRDFNPKPGFGHLAICCPIVLLMDPTPLERTGMWQNDDQNRRFRIVTIKGWCHSYPPHSCKGVETPRRPPIHPVRRRKGAGQDLQGSTVCRALTAYS